MKCGFYLLKDTSLYSKCQWTLLRPQWTLLHSLAHLNSLFNGAIYLVKCDHPKQMQLVCVPDKGQTAPRYQFCYNHAVGRHTADPKFWAFTGLILRACAWIAECATTVSGAKSSISGVFHLLHQLRHGGLVGFSGTENCFFVIVAINLPYLFHGQNLPLRQQSPVKCFRWAAVRPNGPLRPGFQTVPEDRRCHMRGP